MIRAPTHSNFLTFRGPWGLLFARETSTLQCSIVAFGVLGEIRLRDYHGRRRELVQNDPEPFKMYFRSSGHQTSTNAPKAKNN